MVIEQSFLQLLGAVTLVVHILGILNAAHAVMSVRSSRGAIAWSISLITFPWLAIPLYWVLGRNRFQGYAEALRLAYGQHQELVQQAYEELIQFKTELPPRLMALQSLAETFTGLPFTQGNSAQLLIDGQQTFATMLQAIATARHYILLQFYIIHADRIGTEFQQALIAKAQAGVRVYVLYDAIGSARLSRQYICELRQARICVSAFKSSKGPNGRFQFNFRNHRKILVIDGTIAFVGGLNLGDEYLGREPRLSPWRDTHLVMQGPTVQCLQRSFLGDWFWATREVPDVRWQVADQLAANATALIFPTGPADALPACTLFFVNVISLAQERLWIASPYFVPDEAVLTALKLAAIKGVDVRIILPNHPDHWLVYLCSFSYYAEMQAVGVKLYRYRHGFIHQKVVLVDDQLAGVGTVNLDNRSFSLNFEVTSFVVDRSFIDAVDQMLQADLERSRLTEPWDYDKRHFGFKLAVRVSRLLAPIL